MATPRFSIKSLLVLTGAVAVFSAIASAWVRPDAPRGAIVTLGYGVALTAFTLARLAGLAPKAPGRTLDAVLSACVVAFWAGLAAACYDMGFGHPMAGLSLFIRMAGLFLFLAAMPVGGAAATMAVADAIALGSEQIPRSADSSDAAPKSRAAEDER